MPVLDLIYDAGETPISANLTGCQFADYAFYPVRQALWVSPKRKDEIVKSLVAVRNKRKMMWKQRKKRVQNLAWCDKIGFLISTIISTKTEVMHMTNHSTPGHNLKRGIFNLCGKISQSFSRPTQKFILDMVYGLLSGKSCYLSQIGRELKEEIATRPLSACLETLWSLMTGTPCTKPIYQPSKRSLTKARCLSLMTVRPLPKIAVSSWRGFARFMTGHGNQFCNKQTPLLAAEDVLIFIF